MDTKQSLLQFMQALGSALMQTAASMEQTTSDDSVAPCCDPIDQPLANMYDNTTDFDNHFDNVYQPSDRIEQRGMQMPSVSYTLLAKEEEETDVKQQRQQDDQNDPEEYSDEQNGEENPLDDSFDDTEDADVDNLDSDIDPNGDPDRQGDIRFVKDAHLVYKREQDDGSFEELWIFNIGTDATRRSDFIIRDILKGTDIPENEISSDDGSQDYIAWSVGNVQLIKVRGLPQ